MDYTTILSAILGAFVAQWYLFIPAVLVVVAGTPVGKGWLGELEVNISARLLLDSSRYRGFHNVMLATPDGTTQIDHIYASPYGVFVVETKSRKGWIFGSENDRQWTQKIFRHTYRFQNPLRQNVAHTKAVAQLLDVDEKRIHSIVVFVGGCKLKTRMPPNVVKGSRYIRYIKYFRKRVFTDERVDAICRTIQTGQLSKSWSARREHVRHVRGKTRGFSTAPKCPRCGARMVLRKVRRGAQEGKTFWGCRNYPKCRAIQEVS